MTMQRIWETLLRKGDTRETNCSITEGRLLAVAGDRPGAGIAAGFLCSGLKEHDQVSMSVGALDLSSGALEHRPGNMVHVSWPP